MARPEAHDLGFPTLPTIRQLWKFLLTSGSREPCWRRSSWSLFLGPKYAPSDQDCTARLVIPTLLTKTSPFQQRFRLLGRDENTGYLPKELRSVGKLWSTCTCGSSEQCGRPSGAYIFRCFVEYISGANTGWTPDDSSQFMQNVPPAVRWQT